MTGFDELRNISDSFTKELQQSSNLFSSKTTKDLEEAVTKKLQDMKLFSSKLKLLQAKPMSCTLHLKDEQLDNTIEEYGDTVMWKIIENLNTNSSRQADAVKALITTPNENLSSEMVIRKKSIIDSIYQYHNKERLLQKSNALLKLKEAECAKLTAQWDITLRTLHDLESQKDSQEEVNRGPLYLSLSKLVEKLEIMRWLIGQLVCARGRHYDWLEDPDRRHSALALTRVHYTVDMFTQDS